MNTSIAKIRGALFTLKTKILHKNVSIGKDLKLYCKLEIKGPGTITIGDNCSIQGLAGTRTQYVSLSTHSAESELHIGNSVQLLAAKFSCKFSITLGDNVIIEDTSILDTDFHSLGISRETPANESKENCAVRINDSVCIGARSIITKGVTIGEGSLVAPCSVIQQSFPAQSFLMGNPARAVERTTQ